MTDLLFAGGLVLGALGGALAGWLLAIHTALVEESRDGGDARPDGAPVDTSSLLIRAVSGDVVLDLCRRYRVSWPVN